MKRLITLSLLCLTSSFAFACSCAAYNSFCESVSETSIVALIKVVSIDAGLATIETVEVLQGELVDEFELHTGTFCPTGSELLAEGEEAVVNMHEWDDSYSLTLCALSVLPLKNGTLQGQVTPDEENMKYSKFKENQMDCYTIDPYFNYNFTKVYPNPFSQTLFFSNHLTEIDAIELYNLKGQLVFYQQPTSTFAGFIEVPNLPAGLYILKLVAGENKLTFKVVKSS